jgi:predicted O-linked N-acetylglucosamine transferase (SPINDLY family)
MGVPVATLAGDRHSSRTGVSLLTNIGLPDLIAGNHDEYILIAKHLAQDIERLQALRSNLRNMMIQSPLTNAARLTNHLEHYLQVVWEKWKRSVTVRK